MWAMRYSEMELCWTYVHLNSHSNEKDFITSSLQTSVRVLASHCPPDPSMAKSTKNVKLIKGINSFPIELFKVFCVS